MVLLNTLARGGSARALLRCLGLGATAVALVFAHVPAAHAWSEQTLKSPAAGCLTDENGRNPTAEVCIPKGYDGYTRQRWITSGYDRAGYWRRLQNLATRRCMDWSPSGFRLLKTCWPASSRYHTFQSWHESHTGGASNAIHLQARYEHACLSVFPIHMTGCAPVGSGPGTREVWLVENETSG